jgi:hypothetical protein
VLKRCTGKNRRLHYFFELPCCKIFYASGIVYSLSTVYLKIFGRRKMASFLILEMIIIDAKVKLKRIK